MTTDTTALQERIALALHSTDHDPTGFGSHRSDYQEHAAAVFPIIEREVRAAKAEALREAERALERGWPHKLGIELPPDDYDHAGDHATETAQEYL